MTAESLKTELSFSLDTILIQAIGPDYWINWVLNYHTKIISTTEQGIKFMKRDMVSPSLTSHTTDII